MNSVFRYLSIGFEIAVALAFPMALGFWIDQRFDSSPWGLLAGAVVGITLFIRIAIKISRHDGH
ncbi:MAG: AtpZ/AtpI family protein [bacterium]